MPLTIISEDGKKESKGILPDQRGKNGERGKKKQGELRRKEKSRSIPLCLQTEGEDASDGTSSVIAKQAILQVNSEENSDSAGSLALGSRKERDYDGEDSSTVDLSTIDNFHVPVCKHATGVVPFQRTSREHSNPSGYSNPSTLLKENVGAGRDRTGLSLKAAPSISTQKPVSKRVRAT